MFSRFNFALGVVILGLCAWLWGQHQMVLHLRAENHTQAQAIQEQEQLNAHLSIQLEEERQAVIHHQQIAYELRQQVETKRESIKTILVKEPCGRVAMPRAVIEQLQQPSH